MSEKAQQILKTAERMFAAGRYDEVTLDDICKRAGVGKGTVYRYFKDKEDLYYQVILSGLDELIRTVEQVAAEEAETGKGLARVAECVARFLMSRDCLFRLMWSEQLRGSSRRRGVRRQWHAKTDRMLAVMAGTIERGVQEGVYRTSFEPLTVARLLLGMIRVGVRNQHEMAGDDAWPRNIVDLFERGILADHVRNQPE